jgi:F-type H+-transporting ATPase subunit delta
MATHTDAVATIYARSLYSLAEEAGGKDKLVEIGDELEQVCELARADRNLREFLASPIIDINARAKALRDIFADRITDLTLRFLLVLNKKRRLAHLEQINEAYSSMLQEAFGRIEVDVWTPGELGQPQREAIADRIRSRLGKEPVVHGYTDPSMIGGIRLRIGDQLIDGSVATRLRRLRHNLATHGNAMIRERIDQIIEQSTDTDVNGGVTS